MKRNPLFVKLLILSMIGPFTLARSSEMEQPNPPDSLMLALQAAQEWWKEKSAGFPEIRWSFPERNWVMFDGEQNPNVTTYIAHGLDHTTAWFATRDNQAPSRWKIQMSTESDVSVAFSVVVNGKSASAASISEVRIIYPSVDFHGLRFQNENE